MNRQEDSRDADFDLARLIAPVEAETFKQEYWEQKPLHIRREEPGYYGGLLTLDDVDRLLSLSGPSYDNIRVVVSGKETPISQVARRGRYGVVNTLEAIYDHYRSGSTVVLNSLDDRWEPLQRLCRALGAEASAGFQVNVYLTPGGKARGFNPHYDTHDVFIAQVHGSKRWRLYGAPYELPLRDRPHSKFGENLDSDAEFEQEITMHTGDFLYLPRGTVHAATSNDEASVHLTIGIHPAHWSAVIQNALTKLFEDDVRFRRSLPIGFASSPDLQSEATKVLQELLGEIQDKLSPSGIVEETVSQAMSVNAPSLRGHLSDLEKLRGLAADTVLHRRSAVQCHVTVSGPTVRVDFHNKSVEMPSYVAREIEWLVGRAAPFTAADIPGGLDLPGRMVLLQTFVREGLLAL